MDRKKSDVAKKAVAVGATIAILYTPIQAGVIEFYTYMGNPR